MRPSCTSHRSCGDGGIPPAPVDPNDTGEGTASSAPPRPAISRHGELAALPLDHDLGLGMSGE
jgi:hypothetical protein